VVHIVHSHLGRLLQVNEHMVPPLRGRERGQGVRAPTPLSRGRERGAGVGLYSRLKEACPRHQRHQLRGEGTRPGDIEGPPRPSRCGAHHLLASVPRLRA